MCKLLLSINSRLLLPLQLLKPHYWVEYCQSVSLTKRLFLIKNKDSVARLFRAPHPMVQCISVLQRELWLPGLAIGDELPGLTRFFILHVEDYDSFGAIKVLG